MIIDKSLLALTAVGVNRNAYEICNILLELYKTERYGEVPGKNIRELFNIKKDTLFNILESLVSQNIMKYARNPGFHKIVYIVGGKRDYMINPLYETWIPSDSSFFYKVCKLRGHRFTSDTWRKFLIEYDIREKVFIKKEKAVNLAPFQLYSEFCTRYKKLFNREYQPTHIARDLAYCKQIICECSFKNLRDSQIIDFLNWSFNVKTKTFKGEFLIGFLPLCLKDYLASTLVQIIKPGFTKDENGNIIKNET